MPGQASFTTHVVDIGEDEVVKRFRSWDRGEHLREWQALTLLASYAPDLAPAPLDASLTSVPPQVRMSRVPGLPMDRLLAGQALTPGHLDAVAAGISRLHAALPRHVVAGLRPQPWLEAGVIDRMRSIVAESPAADGDAPARAAFDAGMRWLGRATGTWPTTCGTASGSGWSTSRTRAAATWHTSWPRWPSTCPYGTTPGSRPERCSAGSSSPGRSVCGSCSSAGASPCTGWSSSSAGKTTAAARSMARPPGCSASSETAA